MPLRDLLSNNALMMSVAFAAGLLFGGFPAYNSGVITIALIMLMSFSLCGLELKGLELSTHVRTTALAIALSFGLSTGFTILLSFLFQDPIRSGWIIEAAVPSAVCVIPFTFLLGGRVENSLVSTSILYFVSLVLTPLILVLFVGKTVSIISLLTSVLLLILLPIVLSRGVRKIEMDEVTRTILINASLFLVIFAVVGSNRHFFFEDYILVLSILGAAVIRIFGLGLSVEFIGRLLNTDSKQRVNNVLFSTYKNTGMAAALAVTLIGPEAALPAAICTPVEIIWFIFLIRFFFSRSKEESRSKRAEQSSTSSD